MKMNPQNTIFILLFFLGLLSCTIKIKVSTDKEDSSTESVVKIIVENTEEKEYTGWWVYGEGHHIFKDEESLEEWNLEFINENVEELVELYLSITEMEYFPMECKMIGHLKKEIVTKQTSLIVTNFEILYIQGCGEE